MNATVIAVICSLAEPSVCQEHIVTGPQFQSVSMQECMLGQPQLAEWMKDHPGQYIASWRCSYGEHLRTRT